MIASTLRLLNSTRLGTILQTLLYVSGLPYFSEKYSIYKGLEPGGGLGEDIFHGAHPEDPTNTYCYGELGCVTLKYSGERGFHLFPLPIQQIQPFVCLHTEEGRRGRRGRVGGRESCQNVDRDSLADLQLGNGKKGIWIAHGYLESSETPWMEEMVRELLEYDKKLNVFVIDWGAGANPPYTQAVANLPLLAAYTGELMMLIQEVYELKIGHIHFIGHSLGAHLAGLTGGWLNDKHGEMLGRISGLDPAQPYFQKYPPDARLDPSDAFKVDIIHTDAKPMLNEGFNGLGIEDAIGHVDFYPNNGKDQPGCNAPLYQQVMAEGGSLIRGLKRMVGCDHMRSHEYFVESIGSSCSFQAFACSSWSDFLSSGCNVGCEDNESCLRMGFHTWDGNDDGVEKYIGGGNNATGSNDIGVNTVRNITRIAPQSYFLITGNKGPFCREHYLVTVHVGEYSQFFSKVKFNLIFRQRRAFPQTVQLEERDLRKNKTQRYLIADSRLVDNETEEIDVEILPAFGVRWFISRKLSGLTIKSVEIAILDKSQKLLFCPKGKSLEKYDKEIKLVTSTCLKLNITGFQRFSF